jgi:hypothetical protein
MPVTVWEVPDVRGGRILAWWGEEQGQRGLARLH